MWEFVLRIFKGLFSARESERTADRADFSAISQGWKEMVEALQAELQHQKDRTDFHDSEIKRLTARYKEAALMHEECEKNRHEDLLAHNEQIEAMNRKHQQDIELILSKIDMILEVLEQVLKSK